MKARPASFRAWAWMVRRFGIGRTLNYWHAGQRRGWAQTEAELERWDIIVTRHLPPNEAALLRAEMRQRRIGVGR